MKARTLIVTTGAFAALVAGTVQPAGAKVASSCALARAHVPTGYAGGNWIYPVSVQKVLVIGNGTKAPYYEYVPVRRGGCGGGPKAAKQLVHRPRAASAPAAAPGTGAPASADACRFTYEGSDVYIATGVLGCALGSEG
jgi:hypothetical protein